LAINPVVGSVRAWQCETNSFTFREQLAYNMKNTPFGKWYLICVVATAIVSIFLYVVDTYKPVGEISPTLNYVDITLDFFFLGDFVLFLYIADDRCEHMMLPSTMADLASVLPILSIFVANLGLLGIFRFFRCTRIIKLYRLKDNLNLADANKSATKQSEETKALVLLIFTAAAFVFVCSGIIHALDSLSDRSTRPFIS
jgi:hypothetical protein